MNFCQSGLWLVPKPGSICGECCVEAVELARATRMRVAFMHNGRTVEVTPYDTADEAYARWSQTTPQGERHHG